MKKELHKLHSYIRGNRWKLLIFNALLLLIWGPWLFNTAPRIDTEVVINTPYTAYNWLDIGRQGAILTEYIFGLRWFNPHFATVGGYLLICVAGTLMGYLFWRTSQKNSTACAALGLMCFSAPIMTEQFYFELQIFEVAWAYILCTVAVGATFAGILWKRKNLLCIAILCMIWCFSTYQIFVVLYVTLVITGFILLYQRWTIEQKQTKLLYGQIIGGSIAIFLIAFIMNSIITKLFFSNGNEYLTSQIAWLSQPVSQCMKNILSHMAVGALGNSTFYTLFYGVFSALAVVVVVISAMNSVRTKWTAIEIMAVIGLQICPFLLTIAFGGAPTTRAQLAYPMVIVCNVVILFAYAANKKNMRLLLCLLTVIAIGSQTNRTMRMIYTDEIRAQEDVRLATEMEQRIGSLSAQNKPIAIVGVYHEKLNQSCLKGEMIGRSAFDISPEVEPHYFWSGDRGCRMEEILGFSLKSASQEQVTAARQQALTMPSWPAEGSVVDAGEYVIVKLSEDQWPEEVLSASAEAANAPEITNDLQIAVDSVNMVDDKLQIKGWVIREGVNADMAIPSVYLHSRTTGEYLRISTARVARPDLVNTFENGYLYENAGYAAAVAPSTLKEPLKNYDLLIGLTTEGNADCAAETGYQWPAEVLDGGKINE